MWNGRNDWVTFTYQLGSRMAREGHLDPKGLLEFAATQAAAASPLLWVLCLMAVVGFGRQSRNEAERFLAYHSLVPLAFFALLALLHRQIPHWPLVGYLAALAATGPASRASRGLRRTWGAAVALGGFLTVAALGTALVPSLLFLAAGKSDGASITEPYAYRGLARIVEKRKEGRFVVTENHGLTSALWFYTGEPVHWFSRNLHGREFLRWEDYTALRGRDALFVDTLPLARRPDVRELLARGFQEVGEEEALLVTWHGRPARTFYRVRCNGFRGLPPPGLPSSRAQTPGRPRQGQFPRRPGGRERDLLQEPQYPEGPGGKAIQGAQIPLLEPLGEKPVPNLHQGQFIVEGKCPAEG